MALAVKHGYIIRHYLVEELDGHLDVCGLAGNYHQSFMFTTGRGTIRSRTSSARFHDFDGTRAQMSYFVDFTASFANDATDEIVRNEYLLRLQGPSRRWRSCSVVSPKTCWGVRGSSGRRATSRVTGGAVGGVAIGE